MVYKVDLTRLVSFHWSLVLIYFSANIHFSRLLDCNLHKQVILFGLCNTVRLYHRPKEVNFMTIIQMNIKIASF